MRFIAIAEAAVELKMPVSILRRMCESHMINGAVRFGRIWILPENYRSTDLYAVIPE